MQDTCSPESISISHFLDYKQKCQIVIKNYNSSISPANFFCASIKELLK